MVAPLTGLEDHFLSVFAFYETIVLKWKLKFLAFDVPESPRLRIDGVCSVRSNPQLEGAHILSACCLLTYCFEYGETVSHLVVEELL